MLSWKLGDRLAEETARAMLSEVQFIRLTSWWVRFTASGESLNWRRIGFTGLFLFHFEGRKPCSS